MNIKEVLFFCYGNARSASTWSNVPYCFVKALENCGYKVSCVNIAPSKKLNDIWNSSVKRIFNLISRGNLYYFERSILARSIVNGKIRKAINSNKTADLCIFTSFSYWNKFDSRPSLLLCDWTFEMLLKDRLHRNPFFFEKWSINSQNRAIDSATIVVSLFKESAERMKRSNPDANILWPGINVINNLYDGVVDESLIRIKRNSNIILFVGKPAYLKGAKILLDSMPMIWEKYPEMELHCVGITAEDIGTDDSRVKCYGYLRKDNHVECGIYYDLMCRARVFCNPTPEWAGFSSTVEAMFFFTPVVVSKYDNFVAEFGNDIDFGKYNVSFSMSAVAGDILTVVDSPAYDTKCVIAHDSVREYTWESFVDRLGLGG